MWNRKKLHIGEAGTNYLNDYTSTKWLTMSDPDWNWNKNNGLICKMSEKN